VSLAVWISDVPSASEFFEPFLRCAAYDPAHPPRTTNAGGWCDPRLERLITRAEDADVADPRRAQRIWARAEQRTIDRAPLVPGITSRAIELVSPRTGHFTLDADSQLRLDQLWVR
jgi:ABC-type oligopeptide transport system substrate-binding subunit